MTHNSLIYSVRRYHNKQGLGAKRM